MSAPAVPASGADYVAFLAGKAPIAKPSGLAVVPDLNPRLFPHQRDCVAFGLRQGRWGLFLDTGLGKTLCELEWCKHAAAATNGHALILAPLAVAGQIQREGEAFGYDCRVVREADDVAPGINICNYDRLDRLDAARFGAVALDESSILKAFIGRTTRALIEKFREAPFRMCATATPAPNDHMELGQHAEFLGVMPSNEMLMRWFTADQTQMGRYRLKRHGEGDFWDWMASWSRAAETPADLGHDASRFTLPPLRVHRHRAAGDVRPPAGALFVEDLSATNIHDVKRQTAGVRAALAATILQDLPDGAPALIWVDTDYEADAVRTVVPAATEVRGSMDATTKEARLRDFSEGRAAVMLTKPSVAGYGMNWQHCADMIFLGRSFSYESWYQAVRRCWRFGQTRPVNCHLIVAEGEDQIGRVIARKGADHAAMKAAMRAAMLRSREAGSTVRVSYDPRHTTEFPAWLLSAR